MAPARTRARHPDNPRESGEPSAKQAATRARSQEAQEATVALVQRPLQLRAEQPPDDAVVVIRGGVLHPTGIERAATRSFRLLGVLGLSVEAAIGTSVLEACRHSERLAPYAHVQLSSFGRLRVAGFVLLATFDHPHFTLALPDLSELTVARLLGCFDGPVPNPGRAGGR